MRKLTFLIAAVMSVVALGGCVYTQTKVADPGMTLSGDIYAASTSGTGGGMPIIKSSDGSNWSSAGRIFAGAPPSWVQTAPICGSHNDSDCGLWAPQIYFLPNVYSGGSSGYVAFFSALDKSSGKRCIGRAVSHSLGSFVNDGVGPSGSADNSPLLCKPDGSYSLIDPDFFSDTSGSYLLYKRDPTSGKTIAIAPADANGLNSHDPVTLQSVNRSWESNPAGIDGKGDRDRPSVEAPTLITHGGYYYLFFSGNTFETDNYGVGVARSTKPISQCPTPLGCPAGTDYTPDPANPILSGDTDTKFCGVGGQDVIQSDTGHIWYHAFVAQDSTAPDICDGSRHLAVDPMSWSNNWPQVNDGTPSG